MGTSHPSRRAVLGLAATGFAAGAASLLAGCGSARPTGSPAPGGTAAPPLSRSAEFGAWTAGADPVAAHEDLERALGASIRLVSLYADWHTPWPAEVSARLPGHDLVISWEPVDVDFADLLDGAWDDYLTDFLEQAARHRGQVLLRPFAEMNGPWQTWSVDHEDGGVRDVEQWQAAWRHLVTLARGSRAPASESRQAESSRPRFLFCANTTDEGPTPVERYWPGADWVDAIGVDGFNWDWAEDGTPLATAEQVIAPMYARLGRLHPSAPFVVAELGCAPAPSGAPGAQADWFAALYATQAFPRANRVVLFHEDKERDWRLDSDPATLAVHRDALADSGVQSLRDTEQR